MAHNAARKGGDSFSINMFQNMYPHVDLGQKRQFLIRWKCTIALEKLFWPGSENQPRFQRLTKQFENPMTHICLRGKAYPILLNVL